MSLPFYLTRFEKVDIFFMQRLPVTFVLHSGAEFTVTMADVSSLGLFMQDHKKHREHNISAQFFRILELS